MIAMTSPSGRPCTVDNEAGGPFLESLGYVRNAPISTTGDGHE